MTGKESDEDKRGVSIKSRISLLLDSSSTPGTIASGQGSDPHSPVQLVPENEPAVGVKQLIKQLTVDTTPTQSPVMKPTPKPRPLPLDLTKRFASERSADLGSVSLTEATDHHEINKDPQRRNEELALTPSDHRTFVDLKDSQEQIQKASMPEGPEGEQTNGATSKESGGEVQTVRASVFENVVERHSVLVVDEAKPVHKPKESHNSPSVEKGDDVDDGTLVTATYKEPVSPSSPMRISHSFDTVQAIEENRAVSESVPSAQWEDKAMTLRSRRSEGSRPAAERSSPAQAEPTLMTSEQQPRFLRVGALQKWTNTGMDQDLGLEKEMLKEPQRERQVAMDEDRHREPEQEEAAAAPKRLKMLQPEEQQRPRATYFALTGQIQEPASPVDTGTNMGDMAVPIDGFTVRPAPGGSQGKILPASGKTSHDQVEDLMMRSHMSHREMRSALDGQTTEEIMEVEKKKELKMKELEKLKKLEAEKQAHLEFARMKERDLQREFERQRQIAFEKEKQEFEKKQRALERQKQKQQELERERQLQIEKEKRREERERWREIEREKLREQENERRREQEKQRQREEERQRELEKEKLLEIQKEKQRMEEVQRIKELERQQFLEFQKQREMERQQIIELEKQRQREEERQRELDKEKKLLEIQKEKQKMEELERIKELERQQLIEFQKQKQREMERQQIIELEKQRLREKMEREAAEKIKQIALEQEMLRLKEIDKERERQREMERERQKEMEREKQREMERQRQLAFERQELENQRLRQQELEKERQWKEEMERKRLLELEKQKQAERQQILEFEKRRLNEKMEREEAEK
ncbi:hypothetical protein INR49_025588 [Caranx melampygus]|nr:hypothetical protein INR49_025588 [Caranx melampygus]